jgi:ABC-type bacteriocin/lantibiotic exporter with double-glycine peptidase domain
MLVKNITIYLLILILILCISYIIYLIYNDTKINRKIYENFNTKNSIDNYYILLDDYNDYINNNNYNLLNNNYNELNNRYTNVNYETEKINKVDNIENCKNEIELITKSPNDIIGDFKNEICNYENINFEPRIINNKEYNPGE